MARGVDGANVLARRRFAMLAKHRLRNHLRVFRTAGEITVNPNPVHLAVSRYLILADDRHVVLALAGQHARGTSDTGIQVDGHAPLVQALFFELVQRVRIKRTDDRRFLQVHRPGEPRVLLELLQVRLADDRASFHRAMVLRGGQLMRLACRRQFRAAGEMQRFGRPQTIGVVTGTASDATGLLTAITERQADDIVCLPRLNPHRTHDFAAVELNPDQRHVELVVFVVMNVEAEVLRGLRAEQNHVFPNQLGDGIGQLLQPAVIVVTAVVNLVVAMENHFERVLR